jgi:hypothetical protein
MLYCCLALVPYTLPLVIIINKRACWFRYIPSWIKTHFPLTLMWQSKVLGAFLRVQGIHAYLSPVGGLYLAAAWLQGSFTCYSQLYLFFHLLREYSTLNTHVLNTQQSRSYHLRRANTRLGGVS